MQILAFEFEVPNRIGFFGVMNYRLILNTYNQISHLQKKSLNVQENSKNSRNSFSSPFDLCFKLERLYKAVEFTQFQIFFLFEMLFTKFLDSFSVLDAK